MTNVANWVEQDTVTVGTGPVTLSGSIAGSATFAAAFGTGTTDIYYSIESGDDREAGIGSFNGTTNVLTRTTVQATLVSGVYDNTSPTAITLSGTSRVRTTFNAAAFAALGGIPEAPSDTTSYVRKDAGWTQDLKGYGETSQTTAATSGGETLNLINGNSIVSNLTGAYTLTALNTNRPDSSGTWILQHNGQTVSFPASFKFPGDVVPDLSSGNAAILGMFAKGSNWIITSVVNYTL